MQLIASQFMQQQRAVIELSQHRTLVFEVIEFAQLYLIGSCVHLVSELHNLLPIGVRAGSTEIHQDSS